MHPLDALEMKLARPVAVVDACMRQELSAATQTFARVAITWHRLSVRIALETSALLTANVPAEPAALPRVRASSTRSRSRTARSSRSGRPQTSSSRSEWHVG